MLLFVIVLMFASAGAGVAIGILLARGRVDSTDVREGL